jgi:hypothetical protein
MILPGVATKEAVDSFRGVRGAGAEAMDAESVKSREEDDDECPPFD